MVPVRRLCGATLATCVGYRLLPTGVLPSAGASLSNVLFGRSHPHPDTNKKTPRKEEFLYWCRLGDSNARPTHYECVALPTELNRHNRNIHKTLYFILQVLFFAYSYFIMPAIPSVLRPPYVPPLAGTESRYLLQ